MAEVAILIIFVLLLSFALLMQREQQKYSDLDREFLGEKKTQSKLRERIEVLESELSKYRGDSFSLDNLSKEAKINYENIEEIGYSNLITTNFQKTDTIPTFTVIWNDKIRDQELTSQQEKFENWMRLRLNLDTLAIKNVR